MTHRTTLPHRRPNATRELTFDGIRYTVCVGYALTGQPLEVFADGPKQGSAIEAIIDDACILISIALQHGITAAQLGHSLGRVPAFHEGRQVEGPASVIGLVVQAIDQ